MKFRFEKRTQFYYLPEAWNMYSTEGHGVRTNPLEILCRLLGGHPKWWAEKVNKC